MGGAGKDSDWSAVAERNGGRVQGLLMFSMPSESITMRFVALANNVLVGPRK